MTAVIAAFFAGHVHFMLIDQNIAARIIIYDIASIFLSTGIVLTFLNPLPAKRRPMDVIAAMPMILDALFKMSADGFQLRGWAIRNPSFRTRRSADASQRTRRPGHMGISTFLLFVENVFGCAANRERGLEAKNLLESVLNANPHAGFLEDRNEVPGGETPTSSRDAGTRTSTTFAARATPPVLESCGGYHSIPGQTRHRGGRTSHRLRTDHTEPASSSELSP
jgi:hypothetical protein